MPGPIAMNRSSARHAAATSPAVKLPLAGVALLCLTGAAVLALNHPLLPLAAAAGCTVVVACGFRWTLGTLAALLAAAPVAALAPWSGWLTFEELDLLVLAAAAGGYSRMALLPSDEGRRGSAVSPLVSLALLAFATSVAIAAWRGVADAGGFHFGWYQGYHEPMNSLRLAKSFPLALLLAPLWLRMQRVSPMFAPRRLRQGMCLGLAATSLAVLWERLAYTGLLDFSTDYRTTALFWEMHVGGAALDGYLALTLPFAVLALYQTRTPWRIAAAFTILLAGIYACLSSFSRGVYAAVPLGVVLTLWLAGRARLPATGEAASAGARAWLTSGLLVLAFASAAAWMFPSSGYRGMLALLGAFVVLLRLQAIEPMPARRSAAVGFWAAGLISTAVLMAWWIPKGAYVAYAAAVAGALALSAHSNGRQRLLLASYLCVVVGVGLVAWHWGELTALERAWPVMALLAAAGLVRALRNQPLWPSSLQWQASAAAACAVAGAVVAVLAGGAYMSERFSTSSEDFAGRLTHWKEGLALLDTPADWAFGQGLGRYPSHHLLAHSGTDAPGDYRLRGEPGAQHLVLTGGKLPQGWGELFRVSQRVAPVGPGATVSFKVRAAEAQRLHFEVCEKHLLYNGRCLLREVKIEPTGGEWRTMQAPLQGAGTSRGAWYAPRLVSFSVANATSGALAEVDDLALRDAEGRERLANGDFSEGMAHWFFSSDRNHMPWHLKNIAVHTLFDQGVLGLALLAALVAGALWRTTFGSARRHPLAPAMAGALLGFLVVGLFDSLLDVPRVAFLFYLLVLLGLTLRPPRDVPQGAAR